MGVHNGRARGAGTSLVSLIDQSGTGAIAGLVKKGDHLPSALVTMTRDATRARLQTQTDEDGAQRIGTFVADTNLWSCA